MRHKFHISDWGKSSRFKVLNKFVRHFGKPIFYGVTLLVLAAGIFFAFKNGLINGASLMANGEAFDDAVRQCLEVELSNIGIHMVLVEEKSLLDKGQVPTLLNHKELLNKNHRMFFVRYILGFIKKNEIEKECEAQIHKILRAGIKPQFINSHQHLHLLPGIINITISLAKKYSIPYIRIVKEPLRSKGGLFRKAQLIFLNFLSRIAKKMITRSGLGCNDFFVGFINAGNLSEKDIKLAKKLSDKYPNLLLTNMPQYINHIWASDFTRISIKGKIIYLATVIDILTREIVGFSVSTGHGVSLIINAFLSAISIHSPPEITHSDQGSEYKSRTYTYLVENLGTKISMSHKGCPWENGYQESFYDKLKIDLGNPNRFDDMGELIAEIYMTIYLYNTQRIHTKLKMPPNQFNQRHNQILTINSVSIRL